MASLRPAVRAAARARPSLSSLVRLTTPKRFESSAARERDLEVGELQGATFKIEPLRRVGEDPATTRARLLCTSRHPNVPLQAVPFCSTQDYTTGPAH